ncbi:maleylpyruvate isomerase family mycothiol-dependent enzyme [Arthrobacter sp. MDT1-48-3]
MTPGLGPARRRAASGTGGRAVVTAGDALWDLVHAERASLADDLAALSPEQWDLPTLCGEWSVEEVTAHLSAAASVGGRTWIRSMLLAGFRPAVHNRRRLSEHRGPTAAATLDRFRAVVNLSIAPSPHLPAYLGEIVVHAQDIRRPLGIATQPGVDALLPVAEFFVARNFTVPSRRVASGLRLDATDAPFASGEGPEVRGSLLALVMCLAGRPAYLADLSGPGVPVLRSRITGGA